MLKIFVSGLEKECGKTTVEAGIAATMQSLSYSTGVYKPFQMSAQNLNGFKVSPDMNFIKNVDENILTANTYMFFGSGSIYVEADVENIKVDFNAVKKDFTQFSTGLDCVIVEGSNSITNPIGCEMTELDLVKFLDIPLLLVVDKRKTPIDTLISTIKNIKFENISFCGILFNRYTSEDESLEDKYYSEILKSFLGTEILGKLPEYSSSDAMLPEVLISDTLNGINIEKIFDVKIEKL